MNSKKRCRACKKYKATESMLCINTGYYCNIGCATDYGFKNKEKGKKTVRSNQKAKDRLRRKELMSRSQWFDRLQKLVNQVVRIRDRDAPCCTCGSTSTSIKYDSGHFIAVKRGGVDPRRFELTNIHKQCSVKCNQYGSGMRAEYKDFIISKYGKEHLDWLENESNHPSLKDVFPHWKDIEKEIKKYREKIRSLGEIPVI